MVLKFLVEKEFKQLFRNPIMPKLILVFPCLMMLFLPWAATLEIKNNRLFVVDGDCSSLSSELIRKAGGSDYFTLVGFGSSYREALEAVETGRADILLEIPAGLEKDFVRGMPVSVRIAANAVNGTKGALGSSYLSSVVNAYFAQARQTAAFSVQVLHLYNPSLDYKIFMVPALMVMLLTMLCGFLPALNVVSEKEIGTIEQLNVTPVGKFTFIVGKLIPYWVIGLVVLNLCFLLAWLLYDMWPVGHVGTIYLFSVLYILVVSGFGLVISNYSGTMQQAMFVMFFFIMIFILMSGLFTSISSMPGWAQWVARFNPLTYFIQVMRQVYLKGSTLGDLLQPFFILMGFLLFFNVWAILSYQKRKG